MKRLQGGRSDRLFGVFFEKGKWRKVLRHPLLMASVYLERVVVGLCWLVKS